MIIIITIIKKKFFFFLTDNIWMSLKDDESSATTDRHFFLGRKFFSDSDLFVWHKRSKTSSSFYSIFLHKSSEKKNTQS